MVLAITSDKLELNRQRHWERIRKSPKKTLEIIIDQDATLVQIDSLLALNNLVSYITTPLTPAEAKMWADHQDSVKQFNASYNGNIEKIVESNPNYFRRIISNAAGVIEHGLGYIADAAQKSFSILPEPVKKYAPIGLAGLLFFTSCGSKPAPAATITPTPSSIVRSTPTDSLAGIRQYQPEFAELIAAQPWFRDGLNEKEKLDITRFRWIVSKSNYDYMSSEVVIDGAKRDIAVLYQPGLEKVAQDTAKYLKTAMPAIQEFFGIPANWSLLVIDFKKVEGGGSAYGKGVGDWASINANISTAMLSEDGTISDKVRSSLEYIIGHESGHTIVNQELSSGKYGGGPIWYNESMAELAYHVGRGGEERLKEILATRDKLREENAQKGLFTKPLADITLDDYMRGGGTTRGIDLLLSYRRIVGHEAFKNFVYDIFKMEQNVNVTSEDISKNMLLYTPDKSKPEVAKMFNDAV